MFLLKHRTRGAAEPIRNLEIKKASYPMAPKEYLAPESTRLLAGASQMEAISSKAATANMPPATSTNGRANPYTISSA